MGIKTAYILLGSNIGNRLQNLETAQSFLSKEAGSITSASSVYETAAWGITDQPSFYNQVLELQTEIPPQELLNIILNIELEMGRVRREKWAARLIDIDILFYGDEVIDVPGLKIPHPFLHERMFTLKPLEEIAPDLYHPVLKKTISELVTICDDPLNCIKI